MKQIYHEAYSRLYEEAYASESRPAYAVEGPYESDVYSKEPASAAHAVIREIIEKADAGLSRQMCLRMRADAKLFLVTNLTEMIAKPIIGGGQVGATQLFSLMEKDLQLVTTLAGEQLKQAGQAVGRTPTIGPDEVSALLIVETLSRHWQEIKLMGLIWG